MVIYIGTDRLLPFFCLNRVIIYPGVIVWEFHSKSLRFPRQNIIVPTNITMATFRITPFMETLRKVMVDAGLAESSADLYMKCLYTLNNKQPFTNLSFTKQTDALNGIINAYSETTKRTYYSALINALKAVKDKASYKKIYKYWSDLMAEKTKEKNANKPDDQQKSERQKDNWVEWDDVIKKVDELNKDMGAISAKKVLTPQDYDKLLQTVVLSLYAYIPPRRNQDYLDMYIVKKWADTMDKDKNYFDLTGKRFIFNVYKTSKKHGQQIEAIPPTLMTPLVAFVKHHPLLKGNKGKTPMVKMLVSSDGTPITAVNAITRILNKLFGKSVGSSMLRHIYLSNKYGDKLEEMKEDAEMMAHSMGQQKEYIKTSE